MKNLSVFVNSVNKNELMEMVRAYQAYVNFSYEKTDGFDEYFYSDEITDDKIIITSTICGKTTVEEYDLQGDTLNKKKIRAAFRKKVDLQNAERVFGRVVAVRLPDRRAPDETFRRTSEGRYRRKRGVYRVFRRNTRESRARRKDCKKSGKTPENRKRRSRRVCEYPVLSDTMRLLQLCCGFDETTQKIP